MEQFIEPLQKIMKFAKLVGSVQRYTKMKFRRLAEALLIRILHRTTRKRVSRKTNGYEGPDEVPAPFCMQS